MLDKSDWGELIPHRGAMALLDAVVTFDDTRIEAIAESHARADNPLRADGRLRAVALCEYGAQAMAVHGGLLARASGRSAAPGFLVSLRAVELAVARIDDLVGPLVVRAERLLDTGGSWHYAFEIAHAERTIARGRAAVIARGA